MTESISIPVDGLTTYLRCPRRYEFAVVHGLDGDGEEVAADRRLECTRAAICAALRACETGAVDPDELERVALERLGERWGERGDRFHSVAQRRHERRVLEATVRAYAALFGTDHARGVAALAERAAVDGELVGPELPVSATVPLPDREASVAVDARVDYCYRDGNAVVGVRFVPTLRDLGLLRYRSEWEGDVADCVDEHFDPDEERFEPGPVGALLETAAVLEGLRDLDERLGLGARTCRYRLIALAEPSSLRVNWMREAVETDVEGIDLTDVFVDHDAFGRTLERRNPTVEGRLADVVASIADGAFDPAPRWERVSDHSCGTCGYAVCCPEYVSSEVAFDG